MVNPIVVFGASINSRRLNKSSLQRQKRLGNCTKNCFRIALTFGMHLDCITKSSTFAQVTWALLLHGNTIWKHGYQEQKRSRRLYLVPTVPIIKRIDWRSDTEHLAIQTSRWCTHSIQRLLLHLEHWLQLLSKTNLRMGEFEFLKFCKFTCRVRQFSNLVRGSFNKY